MGGEKEGGDGVRQTPSFPTTLTIYPFWEAIPLPPPPPAATTTTMRPSKTTMSATAVPPRSLQLCYNCWISRLQ